VCGSGWGGRGGGGWGVFFFGGGGGGGVGALGTETVLPLIRTKAETFADQSNLICNCSIHTVINNSHNWFDNIIER